MKRLNDEKTIYEKTQWWKDYIIKWKYNEGTT